MYFQLLIAYYVFILVTFLLCRTKCVWQINMFLSRLNGDPIGFSVLGIFVIDKNTILMVRSLLKCSILMLQFSSLLKPQALKQINLKTFLHLWLKCINYQASGCTESNRTTGSWHKKWSRHKCQGLYCQGEGHGDTWHCMSLSSFNFLQWAKDASFQP